jgi:hypothetical protein
MPEWLGSTTRTALRLFLAAVLAAALSTWLFRPGYAAGPETFYGMVVAPGVDVGKAIPRLSDLGVRTVRLRMDVGDWAAPEANAPSADVALAQAGSLDREGFHVVLQVGSEGGAVPSYARALGFFRWLMRRSGAAGVDVVEVFGPVTDRGSDADAFSTTLSLDEQARRYVGGPLRAAWDVVHSEKRKKVLGAAFTPFQQAGSFSARGARTLAVTEAYVRAGYTRYVDWAGLRPSPDDGTRQVGWLRAAAAVFDGKPIWVSEWSLSRTGYADDPGYRSALNETAAGLRPLVAGVCYAPFLGTTGSSSVVQLVFTGYRPVQPAYDAYRSWPKR